MSVEADNIPQAGTWREAWRRLTARRLNRFCLWVVLGFTVAALWGEAIYRWHQWRDTTPPYQTGLLEERYLPPSFIRPLPAAPADATFGQKTARLARHIVTHPMGTDNLGRDVFQRLLQGTRIAFHVGVLTTLIAVPIGLVLGLLGGYFGGRVDKGIVWLYSTVDAMPGLLFILAIAMVVGKGLTGIYLGIGLTTWVGLCRLVRGEVMRQKGMPYVTAANVLGFSNSRILFRHILPNILHVPLIVFSLRFPAAVSTEVFMSFLGIGVQNEPSWGVMINNARLRLWQGMWWELTFVTIAIFLVVLAFNLLGDALRDALDPRLNARANRE
jgi:ABC-type dipeptide/oligopeptide/nickel transport system permease subunit